MAKWPNVESWVSVLLLVLCCAALCCALLCSTVLCFGSGGGCLSWVVGLDGRRPGAEITDL